MMVYCRQHARVAQLVVASVLYTLGPRFDPWRAHQIDVVKKRPKHLVCDGLV